MNDFAASITFDQLVGDPYPIFARLRREAPVVLLPKLGLWMVTRWDDVRQVLSSRRVVHQCLPLDGHADLRGAVRAQGRG